MTEDPRNALPPVQIVPPADNGVVQGGAPGLGDTAAPPATTDAVAPTGATVAPAPPPVSYTHLTLPTNREV